MKIHSLSKIGLSRLPSFGLLLIAIIGPSIAVLLRKQPADCQNVTDIAFLAFYPCSLGVGDAASVLEELEQCDLLTPAAINLAVERVNQASGILPDGSTLRVIPVEHQHLHNTDGKIDKMITVSYCMHACICLMVPSQMQDSV